MPKGVYERTVEMKSCQRKLTNEDDQLILDLYKKGHSQKEIAKKFDCERKLIRKSLKRTEGLVYKGKCKKGHKNPAWKGGRRIDKYGYVLIHAPNHPMANYCGYVREHRLVMSRLLGRNLTKKEVVHHKDGDRTNNNPENLLLFANNGIHLGVELLGKVPKWSEEGYQNMCEGRQQKNTGHCKNVRNVRKARQKKIQQFLHDTDSLENTELEAKLSLQPVFAKSRRKRKRKKKSLS